MTPPIYIGIDPGATGAVAIICGTSVLVYDLPTTTTKTGRKERTEIDDQATLKLASELLTFGRPRRAAIEKVGGAPRQSAQRSFVFGEGTGLVRMAFVAAGIELERVSSQKWKNHFRLNSDKDRSRALAAEVWPEAAHLFARKKDDGRAEAALIAKYLEDTDCVNSSETN